MQDLIPEWERIYLLGICSLKMRRGEDISNEHQDTLRSLHNRVLELRKTHSWIKLTSEYNLTRIDQDVIACTLAPVAEPRLGWLFNELQTGVGSHYPTPALIRELFSMENEDSTELEHSLLPDSPLRSHNLIVSPGNNGDMYVPLRPSSRLTKWFLPSDKAFVSVTGAVEVKPSGSFDDLILPTYCKDQIQRLISWAKYRHVVVDKWGGKPHGGPLVLFSGPSGTGKTFAAEAVAKTLEKRLFRVDLGLLVSKYIGETEKNLNALFDSAAAAKGVLLFDEADSLFGKRGEVKEARDRYANMEVSHLLTRVESYRGVCILTSNLSQYLDFAFTRRFHIVIDFPMPNVNARQRLWVDHLPPKAPTNLDSDWGKKVANAVPLTGGQIRNCALHAAYIAVGEGSPIGYKHIAMAVWNELVKQGREVLPSSLGILKQYLPEEAKK